MEALIGPAIVAAFISALITVVGWYVGHESNRRLEVARRRERIKDVQTALRAEIRSHRPRLTLFKTGIADVEERIGASSDGTSFTPFVPREVESFVFDAIVAEIHILPTEVIDPIVYYYKQIATLRLFAEDLRSDRFHALEAGRKIVMYRDYVSMGLYALELADKAIRAIEGVNSLDAGQ